MPKGLLRPFQKIEYTRGGHLSGMAYGVYINLIIWNHLKAGNDPSETSATNGE